jgi:hypothetical protein
MNDENRLLLSQRAESIAHRSISTQRLKIQIPLSKSNSQSLKTKLSLLQLIMKKIFSFFPNMLKPEEKTSSRIIKMLSQKDLKSRNYIFNSSLTKEEVVSPLLDKDISLISKPNTNGIPISATFYQLIKGRIDAPSYSILIHKNKGFELGNNRFTKKEKLEKDDLLIAEKYQEIVLLCQKHNIARDTLDHLIDLLGSNNLFLDALTTPALNNKFGESSNQELRRSMSLSDDGWILGTSIHISFSKLSVDESETLSRDITIPIESLKGDFSAKNILQEMEILDNVLVTGTL